MLAVRICSILVLAVLYSVYAAPHEESVSNRKEESNIITGIIGKKAHIKDYPYTGSILARTYHYGSVIILNKKWVLTSGFPPSGEIASDILIRVGSDSVIEKGQTSWATKVVIHPERSGWSYDIALIKLKTPLKFGKTVKAIKFTTSTPKEGDKAIISGFGFANDSSSSYTAIKNDNSLKRDGWLRSTPVEVLPYKECNNYYSNTTYSRFFTNTSFCSTPKTDSGPCGYDYGSPLVNNKQLIGVFSGVPICSSLYWPPIYTDIVKFTKWIADTIKQNSSPAELRELKKDIQYY